jgi:hypothetical protein
MRNGLGRGQRPEENTGKAEQVQIQAEETLAILGCAGELGRRIVMAGRKTAGISLGWREIGRFGNGGSAQGKKSEEQNSEGN